MRFAALWYVLASAALLVRVVAHRVLEGVWGLDAPGLLELAVVTAGQAAVLIAVRRLSRSRRGEAAQACTDLGSGGAGGLGAFLGRWSLLVVVLGLLGAAFSAVVLNRLDLRFLALLELLVSPAVQAVVVPWVEARWGIAGLCRALGEGARDPLVAVMLVVVSGVLITSWLPTSGFHLGRLRMWWAGVATLAAGAVLIRAALGRGGRIPGRRVLLMLGLWSLALGVDPFASWIRGATHLLPEGWPTVLRWAGLGGVLAAVTLVALAAGSRAASAVRASAGVYLDASGGVAFVVALIAVLSTFLRRYPTPLWSGVLTTGLAIAATLALAGSVLIVRDRSPTG